MAKSNSFHMPTLTEQAQTGYARLQNNYTTGQLSAINALLKKKRGGRSRKEALSVNPWSVINDERQLNDAASNCETVEDVKQRIEWIKENRTFTPHPGEIGDY